MNLLPSPHFQLLYQQHYRACALYQVEALLAT